MSSVRDKADERVENFLGNLLRVGVGLAALVVLTGAILYLAQHGAEQPDGRTFEGEPPHLRSPQGIITNAFSGRGRGVIQLGLLLLIATPVARVAFSVLAFAWQRDYLYISLTLFVLAVLLISIFFLGQ
jgi:uncharacterized membrane protein